MCNSVPYRNLDVTNTGAVVSAGPVRFKGGLAYNDSAGVIWLKFYDKATAASSSDTPTFTIGLAPNDTTYLEELEGISFSLGLSIRCVTGVADSNATAPAANDCVVAFRVAPV